MLDLIRGLRSEFGTSILFISHNLGVIASMCDRIGVLYAGELVEEGPSQQILHDPRHPYSVGLLRCIPRPGARKDEGRLDTIPGFLPQLGAVIPGCVFADRCALAQDICVTDKPPLYDLGGGSSRCHFHEKAQELPREMSSTLDIPRTLDRTQTPVLRVESLAKTFRQSGHDVHALADVTASLGPARRSASSASRARARPRSRARCSASSSRPPAPSSSTGASCRACSASAPRRTCARCRSSSRTPTRRSTAATRFASCSAARSRSSRASPARRPRRACSS